MRWAIGLSLLLLTFAGCAESQVGVEIDGQEQQDHCWFFCDRHETHVHFDFFPLFLFLGLLGLVIGVVVAVASAGRRRNQQQQVVVVQERRP